jgi:hypothetical protein
MDLGSETEDNMAFNLGKILGKVISAPFRSVSARQRGSTQTPQREQPPQGTSATTQNPPESQQP